MIPMGSPDLERIKSKLFALNLRYDEVDRELCVKRARASRLQAQLDDARLGAPADACVVNTCSVTHEADVKSRATLRRASRCGDDPVVVATGCYAEMDPAAVGAVMGVTTVVPNREKPRLAEVVEDLLRRSGRLLFDLEEGAPAPPEG